ncbi:PKD domain-containing protein [Acanthopleuribacter pedis]|uniref:PKD domain-containing protein n=1 Tax=Acanthopleuribacter pedis TaxID=442870 RepID=A0A8J7QPD4_9BACT|nr:PKD domain-containing protein [Acanthopleuribacter pedis]MBO1322193.1 PKD domain-containing protein [Acanthopleuribacter pedis]
MFKKPWLLLCACVLFPSHLWSQDDLPWAVFTAAGPSFSYMAFPNDPVTVEITGASGENLTYAWDFGNGTTGEGANPEWSYPEAGVYQVSLVVRDDQSRESTPFRRWMFVQDPRVAADAAQIPPWPFFNRPDDRAALPHGQPVSFQGHGYDSQGHAVTLYWDFGDGTLLQDVTEPRHTFPAPGTWNVNLFAIDETGYIQANLNFIALYIYEGDPPAEGTIVAPIANNAVTGDYEIGVGESVTLMGDVTVAEALGEATGYWNIYDLGQGTQSELEGINPPPQTWPAGRYQAFFIGGVAGRPELSDPLVESVFIWVRDDNRAPFNATIVEPNHDFSMPPGAPLGLSGLAEDLDGDELCYKWDIERYPWGSQPALTFDQPFIDQVNLTEPGLYRINLRVEDGMGAATMARSRFVQVLPAEETGSEPIDLQVRPAAPSETLLSGPRGIAFSFAVEIATNNPEAVTTVLWDFSDGRQEVGATLATPVAFEEPGWYPIRVFVQDHHGFWTFADLYSLFIYGDNMPPNAEIAEPVRNARNSSNEAVHAVPVGETVSLRGVATDTDGQTPLQSVWWVDGEFYDIGETPPPLTFNEPGIHQIEYFVTDAAGLSNPFPASRLIQVIDPSLEPQPEIVFPDGHITLSPGDSMRFEAVGRDPNGLAMTYTWNFGGGAHVAEAVGSVVHGIVFPNASAANEPFTVSLSARTAFTNSSQPATLSVTVRQIEDARLEPNNNLDQASPLGQGSYSGLQLTSEDPVDVFQFSLDREERDLRFQIEGTDEALDLTLYRRTAAGDTLLQSSRATADSFVVQQAPPGDYAVAIRLSASGEKRRRMLRYGFSINTLRPSLFLPLVVEDGNLQSTVGLVNPTGAEALLAIQGLTAEGEVVVQVSRTLAAGAQLLQDAVSLFGDGAEGPVARQVRWVRVQSDRRVIGYLNAASADQTRLLSVAGTANLSAAVTVPHIANPDNGWYTRAIVINGDDRDNAIQFNGPDGSFPIRQSAKADSQTDVRFSQVIPRPLPGWGAFETPSGRAGLAGVEVFGRTDSHRESAGIEMIPTRRENPNFTYIANDLYFTHIAADTLNWWTGISLINVSDQTASFRLTGYNAAGQVVFEDPNMSLPPGGKLLRTARDLFGETSVDWLKVEGDGRLTGFELFGDHGLNRLAGLQAASALSDELYFPHLTLSAGRTWTGISLLNVGSRETTVTVRAYNANGAVVAETQNTLAANSKWVALAQDLFGANAPLANAAYIHVEGDQASLCGFQLFGTLSATGLGEQLAGLAAVPY